MPLGHGGQEIEHAAGDQPEVAGIERDLDNDRRAAVKAAAETRDAEARSHFPEYDRRYAALPQPFRNRIDYFRRQPRFRLTLEGADLQPRADQRVQYTFEKLRIEFGRGEMQQHER